MLDWLSIIAASGFSASTIAIEFTGEMQIDVCIGRPARNRRRRALCRTRNRSRGLAQADDRAIANAIVQHGPATSQSAHRIANGLPRRYMQRGALG